ncbi:MAG: 4Fe-4S binding protein, partial [Oscillospiraceae bacterium]|nr:4Fe-4S binding protein [Oscillospiraceae bacterium]
HDVVVVVLDNRITAMTGGQPHPGIGETLSGTPAPALSIPGILRAMGVSVRTADPLDLSAAKRAVLEAAAGTGVRAVVFEHPCVNIARSGKSCAVDAEKCAGCGVCVRELGCPALSLRGGTAEIDASLCSGCGLCGQVCAFGALGVHGGTV